MKNSYFVNLLRLPTSYISKSGSETMTVLYFLEPLYSSRYLIRRPYFCPKRDLCEFLPIQLNYSTELPQCNLQYCSIINAIRVELLLSWLLGHLSIPESRKKENTNFTNEWFDWKEAEKIFSNGTISIFILFSLLVCYKHIHTQNPEVDAAVRMEGKHGIEWWVYYGGGVM